LGPLISGFAGELGWRWPFWIALMLAGTSWLLSELLPETYAPVLLETKSGRQKKENIAVSSSPQDRATNKLFTGTLMTLEGVAIPPIVILTSWVR